jgi:hypothetical protein
MHIIFKQLLGVSFLVVAGAMVTSSAPATTITFEDLAPGTIVTNQYANVVFSSNGGNYNQVFYIDDPILGPQVSKFICTGPVFCTAETILTFLTPVSNLSFELVGDNDSGVVAKVDVFVGGVLNSTVNISAPGWDGVVNYPPNELIDLTAFSNISSIRIHSITDTAGLGWDNFNFTLGASAVPLPPSIVVQLSGLGLLSLIAWRRRRKAAVSASI